MSVRLGIILSSNVTNERLESIRDKYDLGLILIDNKYVSEQLADNESLYQVSKSGCDDLTGIGAFELYIKNLAPLKSVITDPLLLDSVISEYEIRREGYKTDVVRWLQIIKDLKSNYKLETIALFWHFFSTSFEEEKITFEKKERCEITNLDCELLMKMPENVILYFD